MGITFITSSIEGLSARIHRAGVEVSPCRPVRTLSSPTKWRCHITACEGMKSRQSCTFIATKWSRHVYNGCCINVSGCISCCKASHKRSQSNFRVIAVLITTTSVYTVLSRMFSAHVELHARHVQTSLCLPPRVYRRLVLQYHMVWMTTHSHNVW